MIRTFFLLCVVAASGAAQDAPLPPEPFAFAQAPQPPQAPQPAAMPRPAIAGGQAREAEREAREMARSRDREERDYRKAQSYLDRLRYAEAAEAFREVLDAKGARADAAHYWRAYSLARTGAREEALAVIQALKSGYPNSRWLDDAKALEIEVRQASGRPVSPEAQSDEELKLFAINSLIGSDPDRVVPLLGKLLRGTGSPKLKERALFVLAQTRSPQARDIVLEFAKGKGNPDLQAKAVEYFAIHAGKENGAVLQEIYNSTNDTNIRRRIMHGFMVNRDKERLLQIARSDSNAAARREAVQLLGAMGAQSELASMYAGESSVEVRGALMQAMMVANNHEKLIEIARTEKDPKLRRDAIHLLGTMRRPEITDALVGIYTAENDSQVKRQVQSALMVQGNAKGLIEIARKESNPELKRHAVQLLATMKSKEATDFMVELLNK